MMEFWGEAHQPADAPGSRLSPEEKDDIWEWMQKKDIPVSRAAARAKSNGHGH